MAYTYLLKMKRREYLIFVATVSSNLVVVRREGRDGTDECVWERQSRWRVKEKQEEKNLSRRITVHIVIIYFLPFSIHYIKTFIPTGVIPQMTPVGIHYQSLH